MPRYRVLLLGRGALRIRPETVLCRRLAQACETTAASTIAAAPNLELIHPGVLKYFREIRLPR